MRTLQVATANLKDESLDWAYCKAIGQTPMLSRGGLASHGFCVSYTPRFGGLQLNAIMRFRRSEHFGDKIKDDTEAKCFVLAMLGEFVDIPVDLCVPKP